MRSLHSAAVRMSGISKVIPALMLALSGAHCGEPQLLSGRIDHVPAYEITLDVVDPERIHGWAWDVNDPDRPVKLIIYDGNDMITTIVADDFRQDLFDAGKGNGKHAFDLPLPAELCDGTEHLIHAQVAGEPPMLGVLPRSLVCSGNGADAGVKN